MPDRKSTKIAYTKYLTPSVALAAQGIELVGTLIDHSEPAQANLKRRGIAPEYYPDQFHYDGESDTFRCPQGKRLARQGTQPIPGAMAYPYQANWNDCGTCPARTNCCPIKQKKKPGRKLIRRVEDQAVLDFRARMETASAPALYRQRSEVGEFPNLWIKEKIGLRKFCLRGLSKADLEALWTSLTYNIQQWFRISWRPAQARLAEQSAALATG